MLNADKTSPEEANRLEMLFFRWVINGLATVSWKDLMSSEVIFTPVAFPNLHIYPKAP